MPDLNRTPSANRLHVTFLGRTNAGKSTIINRLTGQEVSLVSPIAGTTTDPVSKAMELFPLGPVLLVDTAGLDDRTELGGMRRKKTMQVLDKTDLAVLVIPSGQENYDREREYLLMLRERAIPVVVVYNEFDGNGDIPRLDWLDGLPSVRLGLEGSTDALVALLIEHAPSDLEPPSLTGDLLQDGDTVVLVAPQDGEAPKGRLILPQVQTLRDLLDRHCVTLTVQPEELVRALDSLKQPPSLVITDSQVFGSVYPITQRYGVRLTSFSILMAKQKGDFGGFLEGAQAIRTLVPGDRVLIAEGCTHHAQKGDIAREKLPGWLQEKAGGALDIDVCAGQTLPDDLTGYRLIVHCGNCMHNRRNMLSKQQKARQAGVPMTNFGLAIAALKGILDKVVY